MKSRFFKVLSLACLATLLWLPATSVYGRSNYGYRNYGNRGENYHFGFIYGAAGYNSLQTSLTNVVPSGTVGGSVGAGYEFRYKGLWVSLGVGAQFHRSTLTLNQYSETREGFDTQNQEVTFHYNILSQQDKNKWTMVDVPLMIGYYVKGFYFGVGPKLSFALQPNVVSQGQYDFSAYYPRYDYIFRDMPEHGYTQYEFEEAGVIPTNPLVSVCAELGYDLLSSAPQSSVCHILKIGGYFEYGINSIIRPSSTAMYLKVDENNAAMAHPGSYLGGMMTAKRVVPYFVGVKLTYMIGGSRHGGGGTFHKGCMCYQQ